jgi:hypothetical protein
MRMGAESSKGGSKVWNELLGQMLELGLIRRVFPFFSGSNQGKEELWEQVISPQLGSFAPRRRMKRESHFDSREAGGTLELNATP